VGGEGPGHDGWLEPRARIFDARLEVSAILRRRFHEKLEPMTPTDEAGLPGYAAVVERSAPQAVIEEKP
jgi:hypothetical protein